MGRLLHGATMLTSELNKHFISSHDVFEQMQARGWCDGFGRPLSWDFWQRFYARKAPYVRTESTADASGLPAGNRVPPVRRFRDQQDRPAVAV